MLLLKNDTKFIYVEEHNFVISKISNVAKKFDLKQKLHCGDNEAIQ